MVDPMKVDVPKLRASVKRLSKTHKDRRKTSDLVATIRPLLPEIERLREDKDKDKVTWAVIAAGLAEQGVVEGKEGKPLTEKRLTSVISKIKSQNAGRAAREAKRLLRGDVSIVVERHGAHQTASRSLARLAPELTRAPPSDRDNPPISEAEILSEQRQKQQHLFKKD
jgi:hypothetical protein